MLRMNLASAFVFLVAAGAEAREVRFQKAVSPSRLRVELQAAGFDVQDLSCLRVRNDVRNHCVLVLPNTERRDPSSVISAHKFQDPAAAGEARRTEIRRLRQKLADRTITADEKDVLLGLMLDELGY